MAITNETRKAYSEVYELIKLFTEEERNKIPEKIREIFEKEKDNEYVKNINPNIPIKDQNLMEETLSIIAYLNLEYICEDEQEKERLRKIYKDNQKKYDDIFQIAFEPDKVFKKEEQGNSEEVTTLPVAKTESFWGKMVYKILNFFHVR